MLSSSRIRHCQDFNRPGTHRPKVASDRDYGFPATILAAFALHLFRTQRDSLDFMIWCSLVTAPVESSILLLRIATYIDYRSVRLRAHRGEGFEGSRVVEICVKRLLCTMEREYLWERRGVLVNQSVEVLAPPCWTMLRTISYANNKSRQ
jgi:hypothetical protein